MLKNRPYPILLTSALFLLGALIWTTIWPRAKIVPTITPTHTSTTPVKNNTAIPGPTWATTPPTLVPTTPASPSVEVPEVTQSPNIPEEHYIFDISGHKQYFPLGCEAAAAKDWANYFHKDFNEFEFQYKLPLSDNPDLGFVGEVNAPWGQVPPYGYGVHAGPIAKLLNAYGISAKAYKNYSIDKILNKVAHDKPVITWVIGNVVGGVPYRYHDSKGNEVLVAAYEHVVIVTGYNEKKIRYMNNGNFFEVPKDIFLNSWGILGNMVVVDR
jgi:uncharacterized protein YvpB